MSIEHLNQAFKANIDKSSLKFILVALADYANEIGEAYPSVETLCNKTALNGKTVRNALTELVSLGAIVDTGRRFGRTQQVKVWKLTLDHIEKTPKSRTKSTPKNGTPSEHESYPKTDTLKVPENGTLSDDERYPIFPDKVPKNGHLKGTQNWVADPSVLLTPRSDPPDTQSRVTCAREKTAVDVLDYLNQKSRSRYKPVEANLRLIRARIDEGHSFADLTGVVDMQCEKWRDSKMAQYLRPATLFNAEKFNQYIGVLPAWLREQDDVPEWAQNATGHTYDGEIDDD